MRAQVTAGLHDALSYRLQKPKEKKEPLFEVIGESGDSDEDLSAMLHRLQKLFNGEEQKPEESYATLDQGVLPGARAQPRSSNGILAAFKAMAKQWSPEERRLHRKRLKERIKEQEEQEKRWEEARLLEKKKVEELEVKRKRRENRDILRRQQEEAAEKAEREAKKAAEAEAEAKAEREATAAGEEQYKLGSALLADAEKLQNILAGAAFRSIFERFRKHGRGGDGVLRRGILIPSGGTTLINHAYATIKVLRETLGCMLPIEIVFNGEREMDKRTCAKFEGDFRGVRCVDAGAFNWYPKHHRPVKLRHDDSEGAKGAIADQEGHKDHKGFQFKVFSLCYVTSFDEVLMLDSDNLPLRNPEYLFESAEYRGSGSLFFSDWWDILDWVKPEAYTAFGLQYPSFSRPTLAAESGQLLLNRNMHSDVLEWLWFLNSHADTIYKLMYGDKDTFSLAFHLAGKAEQYHQVAIPPSCPLDASPQNAEPITYLHAGMVQHDPSGLPAFLHRTAEGKVYPFNHGFRRADYLTVPLSSRRAASVLGSNIPHKLMGLMAKQIDHTTYNQCPVADPRTFHKECGVSLKSGAYPVPVIPVNDMPELARVLNASYAVHDALQHAFHTTFVLGRR
ncbi:g3514 [Coccomyxa elongata]